MKKKSVLVLSGDGMNCERESARAFTDAGADAQILHVNEFLQNPKVLFDHQVFCIPGGFSFGDELRSGKILAEKMRTLVADVFREYTAKGGLTIGICNGFQVLIQLGAFSAVDEERTATLAVNDHQTFKDRWVEVKVTDEARESPWFSRVLGSLHLPVRHKEGRIVLKQGSDPKSLRIPLVYSEAINGSYEKAAALLDPTGRILGLMPHPEAATHAFLNPLPQTIQQKEKNAEAVKKLFEGALNS
jgi:phosphoribosylformylglycinamidine (FGAM) synthase-like amidotransferase family enzyme